jgi:hypothetical protein
MNCLVVMMMMMKITTKTYNILVTVSNKSVCGLESVEIIFRID